MTPNPIQPDPRLARALWQLLILGGIATVLAISAGAPQLGFGSAAWLVALPLAALAAAYRQVLAAAGRGLLVPAARRRATMTFVLPGSDERVLACGFLRGEPAMHPTVTLCLVAGLLASSAGAHAMTTTRTSGWKTLKAKKPSTGSRRTTPIR
jgi:hypothetical protein